MANSTFPIPIGAPSSNGRIIDAVKSGRLKDAFAPRFWWFTRFRIADAGALDNDTDQTFDLHVYDPNNLFPANVERRLCIVNKVVPFTGGAVNACTAQVGDAGDTDALFTATSVFSGTGLLASTPSAAEYAPRIETAFIPTLRLVTTNGSVNALTAGELLIAIGFNPLPSA